MQILKKSENVADKELLEALSINLRILKRSERKGLQYRPDI